MDTSNDEEIKDEVDDYVESTIDLNADQDGIDICKWWNENQGRFLGLLLLSQKYLCIPATTAAAESKFSLSAKGEQI